jgi:hypothetical protein
MDRKFYAAIGGALVALVVASASGAASGASGIAGVSGAPGRPASAAPGRSGAAGAPGPRVTVRVEGLSRTLLPPTSTTTRSGWVGAPTHKCPAASVAGALDSATKHGWGGRFESGLGDYKIASILGETHASTAKNVWKIFVNNAPSSKRACGIALHSGEQLLFAAVPRNGAEYPTAIEAPRTAAVGSTFYVTVVWFNAKGKAKPLAGATLSVAGRSGSTNGRGVVPLTPRHSGTFVLQATDAGYIRPVPVAVHIS